MASRDQGKTSANLLRQSLSDSGAVCPGPDILAAYFELSLDAEESARYQLHLSQCARCREQLAALDRAGSLAAADGTRPQLASYWGWLWDWRLLAPVAAALIVAAVWVARRPLPKQPGKTSPLVAMSQREQVPTMPPTPERTQAENGSLPSEVSRAAHAPNLASDLGPAAKPSPKTAPPAGAKQAETDSVVSGSVAASRMPTLPANETGGPPAPGGDRATPQTETIGPGPTSMEMKRNQALAPARVSAKTDAEVAAQALALKVKRPSTGGVIATPDPQVLWGITEAGFVERSEDGGASWLRQLPDARARFSAGSAPSEKICWLVGPNGVIFLTNNAKDWRRISPPAPANFVAITAEDVSTATVTAADGRKFTTRDGGAHWSSAR
ncbi:MAG TPA: hypothetical protein VEJ45_02700 [Candidatus Acidoferrales bacterium]|nr:hypothetical protein [Candidatus Acidoferrales bacterium]